MTRVLDNVIAPLLAGISLLTLKPTSDKKVDADDNAAAIMPANNSAPKISGTSDLAAQIMTVYEGVMSGLARLIKPPAP